MHRRSSTDEIRLEDLNRELIRSEFQRLPNDARVAEIKTDLLEEKRRNGQIESIGVLIIGVHQGKKYIIDGQHRFQAYRELNEPYRIAVQTWECSSMSEMEEHFRRINRYIPVESYVLESKSSSVKNACDIIIRYVELEYTGYPTKSQFSEHQYPNPKKCYASSTWL